MPKAIKVLRQPDGVLYDVVRNATEGTSANVVIWPMIGTHKVIKERGDSLPESPTNVFCEREGLSIEKISITIGNYSLLISRPQEELHDLITIEQPPQPGPDSQTSAQVLGILSKVAARLTPHQSISTSTGLSEAYISAALRLEVLHENFLKDNQRLNTSIEEQYQKLLAKQTEAEATHEALKRRLHQEAEQKFEQHKQELEREHAEKQRELEQKINQREAELDERAKHLDDIDAKAARRKIRLEIQSLLRGLPVNQAETSTADSLKDGSKNVVPKPTFALTEGTIRLRNSVRFVCWFAAILFAAAEFVMLFFPEVGPTDTLLRGFAQTFMGLGFAATVIFLIRWENRWFQQHADEEFYRKRLELDFDRASWLVEMSLEYAQERKADIPPELLSKLSRGLFDYHRESAPALHPADQLASALLGSASEAHVQLPNGSHINFDRKGIGQLGKQPVGSPTEDSK